VAYHKRELATIPLPPGQYLLRSDQVIKYLPISIWSFLEGVKCGRYPAAVSISPLWSAKTKADSGRSDFHAAILCRRYSW
jgi:hypothetical protein